MTVYYADAKTEDGYDTVFECEATSRSDAWDQFTEGWPDCRIRRVYTAEQAQQEENDRYRRLCREMDYD